MINYGWPDIIILSAAIISATRGWKLGFINELAGTIAVIVAVIAGFSYTSSWDGFVQYWTRLGSDSAHIFALCLFALTAYVIIATLAYFLNRYAHTAILSPINALGGALLGAAKAVFLFWVILYVALFLPMSRSLRNDLRGSFIVPLLVAQGNRLDNRITPATPWFARPMIRPYLRRHHL